LIPEEEELAPDDHIRMGIVEFMNRGRNINIVISQIYHFLFVLDVPNFAIMFIIFSYNVSKYVDPCQEAHDSSKTLALRDPGSPQRRPENSLLTLNRGETDCHTMSFLDCHVSPLKGIMSNYSSLWLLNDRFTNNDSGGRLIQPRLLCELVTTSFGRDD
jgi:hypothetical protein